MSTHRVPGMLVSSGVETSLRGAVLASGDLTVLLEQWTTQQPPATRPVNQLPGNLLLLQGDLGQILLYFK